MLPIRVRRGVVLLQPAVKRGLWLLEQPNTLRKPGFPRRGERQALSDGVE